MEVKTIAVIGAGEMGREVAYAAASAGYTTILEDISRARIDEAIAWIATKFDAVVSRGELSERVRDAGLRNLSTASTVEGAFAQADLIIETVADEMEMKIELVMIFDKFARPNAIFASNGSLSITEMAEVTFRAERCIGMRFCDSAADGKVLELVRGSKTSQETVDLCSEDVRRMGRKVVIVGESQRSIDSYGEQKAASARN
jgi:3-hydroxybutyryl-CoA dehydrogenase